MDAVERAKRELEDAQAGIPKAEERAKQFVADARAKVETARRRLWEAIAYEYLEGARVSELVRSSGYNRESIRRILRDQGIQARD